MLYHPQGRSRVISCDYAPEEICIRVSVHPAAHAVKLYHIVPADIFRAVHHCHVTRIQLPQLILQVHGSAGEPEHCRVMAFPQARHHVLPRICIRRE